MKKYCVTRHGGLSETLADGGDLVYRVPDVDARIAELEKAHARYELIRTLTPREFTRLWQENIAGCGRFDDLVDEAIATGRFTAKNSTL